MLPNMSMHLTRLRQFAVPLGKILFISLRAGDGSVRRSMLGLGCELDLGVSVAPADLKGGQQQK